MPKIKEDISNTIVIQKSKFITYLHKTNDEDDAKEFLKIVKKEHSDATHHCTAMVIGNINRSSDDGEPSGTAGHPMLDVLLHNDMQDILAVVVRYFGGIKLGTGGLVRAYSSSVQEALQKAMIVEEAIFQKYEIKFSYDLIGKLDNYFRKNNIEVVEKEYEELVRYEFVVEQDITKDLKELSNGSIEPRWIEEVAYEKERMD